jgi:chaperonin GroES
MKFRPLHDRIAIQPLASEEKTTGGIIIPDSAQEKPIQGKVVAVGNGARDQNGNIIPLEVKVGDVVIYGKWGGTEVKIDGQDLIIMKESDVVGILPK